MQQQVAKNHCTSLHRSTSWYRNLLPSCKLLLCGKSDLLSRSWQASRATCCHTSLRAKRELPWSRRQAELAGCIKRPSMGNWEYGCTLLWVPKVTHKCEAHERLLFPVAPHCCQSAAHPFHLQIYLWGCCECNLHGNFNVILSSFLLLQILNWCFYTWVFQLHSSNWNK